jgi:hypothetical protein
MTRNGLPPWAAYVAELNRRITVEHSSTRRGAFWKRLKSVSQDLESAEKDLSQFSTRMPPSTLGTGQSCGGGPPATDSTLRFNRLEGLKQIYSDNNVRVRAVQAQVTS